MTKPHEDLYRELQDWIALKDGVNDPCDVAEAIGQMFAASIVAMHPDNPVSAFRRKLPEFEALIAEMWAQSADRLLDITRQPEAWTRKDGASS